MGDGIISIIFIVTFFLFVLLIAKISHPKPKYRQRKFIPKKK
jgi:hypothetical protein